MKQPQINPVNPPSAYPTPGAQPNPATSAPSGHIQPQIAHPQPMPATGPVANPYAQPQNPAMPGQIPGQAPYPQAPMQGQMPAAPMPGAVHPAQMPPMAGQMQTQQAASVQSPMASHAPLSAPMPEKDDESGEKALPRIAIHAFCERQETAGTIQAMSRDWRMVRTNLKIYMGGLPAAIDFYRDKSTPAMIVFESGLRGPQLFEMLGQLASVCDSDTKVIMVGAINDIKLYRELMDQGISDYLVPPFHPLTLIRAIADQYADPEKPFTGRVVGFFGAKGGVGSSTLAHNTAWGLASKFGQETSLVDLDSSWGTTSLDFNYDSVQGLEEALSDPERLDETLLDRIMVRHTDKLSILPAAGSLGNMPVFDTEAYETLVNGVRSLSPLTILDMPHIWAKWTSNILVSCDDIVITANPDLANLRNCKNLVDFLKSARPNDAEPLLILNKTGVPKTAEIPVKDFAAAVGLTPALVLAYEPTIYTEASNDGKMLSDIKDAAAAFEGIMYLGQRLKTGEFAAPVAKAKKGRRKKSSPAGEAKKGGLLSKLKKRKQ